MVNSMMQTQILTRYLRTSKVSTAITTSTLQILDALASYIDFKEDFENKHKVLGKGNQQTFLQFPEVTAKAMNK